MKIFHNIFFYGSSFSTFVILRLGCSIICLNPEFLPHMFDFGFDRLFIFYFNLFFKKFNTFESIDMNAVRLIADSNTTFP